jgi:hypothetical protein
MKNAYKILIREHKVKRPFCRQAQVRVNVKWIGCDYADWIYLADDNIQWRVLVNASVSDYGFNYQLSDSQIVMKFVRRAYCEWFASECIFCFDFYTFSWYVCAPS